jgi:hypothetical protein
MWWKKIAFCAMRQEIIHQLESNKKMMDDCIHQLMKDDVKGPKLKSLNELMENNYVAPDDSRFHIIEPELSCQNYNSEQIRIATQTFGMVFSMSGGESPRVLTQYSQDVGMLSQEMHIAAGDIRLGAWRMNPP